MQMSSQNSALFIKSSNTSLQLLLQPMTMLGMLLQHEKKKWLSLQTHLQLAPSTCIFKTK